MRWLDAFGRWLDFDGSPEDQRDAADFIIPGTSIPELDRLNEPTDDIDPREDNCAWPGEVEDGDDQPWLDAGTARLLQALAEDTKRLQSRGITEGTGT